MTVAMWEVVWALATMMAKCAPEYAKATVPLAALMSIVWENLVLAAQLRLNVVQ
jgi:hypothetical protein